MPLFEYACNECGSSKEIIHKMDETPVVKCDQCHSVMYRKISGGVGVIFNGDWFKTKGKY